ncbi:MAG TPA: DUF3703 domain-containing protein [Pseudomonas sp.]|nr:DUF3703 domain-containing protein [Pseudomonas sp.]
MTRTQAFRHELQLAREQRLRADSGAELRHLERAHILGQPSFFQHGYSHWLMLLWAWRQHDWAELAAQLLRLPGSFGSLLGVYPLGNPGTRRVGPLTPQAVPEDLRALLK